MKKAHLTAFALAGVLGLAPAVMNAAPKMETKKVEKKEKTTEAKEERHESVSAEQAKLQKEAKISMDEAKEIALKHVRKDSKIESSELEREHGKLIYSFDIREPHRKDVTEVNVNAMDGKIVAIDHENPKKEAAEKKQEAKEKH